MDLKKLGAWAPIDHLPAAEAAAFAQRMEAWGYSALWIPEGPGGREVLTSAGWLLANTTRLIVGTGVASIYARDPMAAASAQKSLNEISGGRFLLGLGVSHEPLVTLRNHVYGKPLESMRTYLKGISEARYHAPVPRETPKTIIAALGPKMLELSRDLADGALTYNATPEHTAEARRILGPGKLLCVPQALLLEPDAGRARAAARKALSIYLAMPNYLNHWRRLGFGDADFANGGSDRLVDAVVAWGDERVIRERIDAHRRAGADHVCIQALSDTLGKPDERLLALLAPGA